MRRLHALRAQASAPGVLLAALAFTQPWLEGSMARHMGLELPALFLLGVATAQIADIPLRRALDVWNARGIPGLLFALCVTGFWMLPVALDAAVLHPAVAFFKVLSILIAGLLYRASWNGADMVSHAFFALSAIGMMLSVGLLYQDAPQQLCSTYRIDEQSDAGRAIMAWAIVGLAIWLGSVGLMSLDAES